MSFGERYSSKHELEGSQQKVVDLALQWNITREKKNEIIGSLFTVFSINTTSI